MAIRTKYWCVKHTAVVVIRTKPKWLVVIGDRVIHSFLGPSWILIAIGKRSYLLGVRHDAGANNVEASSLWLTMHLVLLFFASVVAGRSRARVALRVVKGRRKRQAAGLWREYTRRCVSAYGKNIQLEGRRERQAAVWNELNPLLYTVQDMHPTRMRTETSGGSVKEIYPLVCTGRTCIRLGVWYSVLAPPL